MTNRHRQREKKKRKEKQRVRQGIGKVGGQKEKEGEKKGRIKEGREERRKGKGGTNEKKSVLFGQNNRKEELRRCLFGRSIASVSSILNLPEEEGLTFAPRSSCNSSNSGSGQGDSTQLSHA